MSDWITKDICASLRNPIVTLPRRIWSFLTLAVLFSIFWFLLSHDRLPSFISVGPTSTSTTNWRGWAHVDNIFVLYATNT